MIQFQQKCACSTASDIRNPLYCAPCPPPSVTYRGFRDIAEQQNLTKCEIDTVAKQCNISNLATISVTLDPNRPTLHEVKEINAAGCNVVCIVLLVLSVLFVLAAVLIFAYCKRYRKSGIKRVPYRSTPSTQPFMEQSDICSVSCSGTPVADNMQVYFTADTDHTDSTRPESIGEVPVANGLLNTSAKDGIREKNGNANGIYLIGQYSIIVDPIYNPSDHVRSMDELENHSSEGFNQTNEKESEKTVKQTGNRNSLGYTNEGFFNEFGELGEIINDLNAVSKEIESEQNRTSLKVDLLDVTTGLGNNSTELTDVKDTEKTPCENDALQNENPKESILDTEKHTKL